MATIRVQVLDGGAVVKEVQRHTSAAAPSADSLRYAARSVMGWLQAWSDQVTDEQWRNDVARARDAAEA